MYSVLNNAILEDSRGCHRLFYSVTLTEYKGTAKETDGASRYCTYLAPPTDDGRMHAARHPEVWERQRTACIIDTLTTNWAAGVDGPA